MPYKNCKIVICCDNISDNKSDNGEDANDYKCQNNKDNIIMGGNVDYY